MKKILLIGKMSGVIRSISEGLEEFQVQICSENMEMVQSMERITKPDMMIFCQIGIPDLDAAFFHWVTKYRAYIPVLVISTEDKWQEIAEFCHGEQFTRLFRPVTLQKISATCRVLVGADGDERERPGNIVDELMEEWQLRETKKVMVVDDSPLFLRTVKTMLEDFYEVSLANSGEKALEQIPKKKPDIILLDYEMGGMSGKDTFEAILADKEMRNIPVIFLTSVSKKERVFDVLEKKPAGYVLKPVDKHFLLEEIKKVTDYV